MKLLMFLRRRPAPGAAPPPAPPAGAPTAETLLADAEAAEAARLALAEREALAAAERQAALTAAEHEARLAEIKSRADLAAERRQAKLADDRKRAAEAARRKDLDAEAARRAERASTRRVKIATFTERARRLLVNIVVNLGAGYGQAMYFHDQLAVPLLAAVMLAAGLELVAVTTLDYGLAARKAGRPYKIKFAAASLLAAVVAALNYSHWILTPRQQGLAIPLAVLSLLCPLLWAWYAAARDAETASVRDLAAPPARSRTGSKINSKGQQDHAQGSTKIAKFTAAQWIMWPRETAAAKRAAVRYTITDPDEAYRAAAQHAASKIAQRRHEAALTAEQIEQAETRAAAAERAAAEMRELLTAAQAALENTQQPRQLDPPAGQLARYLPTPDEVAAMQDQEEKRDSAEDAFRQALLDGVEIPGATLGQHYGMSDSWGRARARAVRNVLVLEISEADREDDDDPSHTGR